MHYFEWVVLVWFHLFGLGAWVAGVWIVGWVLGFLWFGVGGLENFIVDIIVLGLICILVRVLIEYYSKE